MLLVHDVVVLVILLVVWMLDVDLEMVVVSDLACLVELISQTLLVDLCLKV